MRNAPKSASTIPGRGRFILLAERDSWFAYPFWLDDRQAPDYARTVDIHRKPGYDPCELLLDPKAPLAEQGESYGVWSRNAWDSARCST